MNHLVIILYFRAPLGGLQHNVLATARVAASAGWKVSVICPAGPFQEEYLRPAGIHFQAVDFQSESSIADAKRLLGQANVIHAHPGPSRACALDSASDSGVPVVFTIHGAWFDNVQQFAPRFSSIICVSEAIKESVVNLCPDYVERIECIPNGVDAERFHANSNGSREPGLVIVASRLDADKRQLINTLVDLWEVQASRESNHALRYMVAGHGTLQEELESAAARLGISVMFLGWQDTDDLAQLYNRAAVVIASGRAALEALAAGRPTLALASAGAAEAFELAQFSVAAYSNFGGFGAQPASSPDALFDKLCSAANCYNIDFANQAFEFVLTHHDNAVVNRKLIDVYERALGQRS